MNGAIAAIAITESIQVPVFAKSFDAKGVTFEINPLFNAICFKEKLPKEFVSDFVFLPSVL